MLTLQLPALSKQDGINKLLNLLGNNAQSTADGK